MAIEFFQTLMGKQFFEGSVPKLLTELKNLNENLKKMNELKAKELAQKNSDARNEGI